MNSDLLIPLVSFIGSQVLIFLVRRFGDANFMEQRLSPASSNGDGTALRLASTGLELVVESIRELKSDLADIRNSFTTLMETRLRQQAFELEGRMVVMGETATTHADTEVNKLRLELSAELTEIKNSLAQIRDRMPEEKNEERNP